jgi:hypothetical protein
MYFCIDDSDGFEDKLFKKKQTKTETKKQTDTKTKTETKTKYTKKVSQSLEDSQIRKALKTLKESQSDADLQTLKDSQTVKALGSLKDSETLKFTKSKKKTKYNTSQYKKYLTKYLTRLSKTKSASSRKSNSKKKSIIYEAIISDNLEWLKKYVYQKAESIVNHNFKDFERLYNTYLNSHLRFIYSELLPSEFKNEMDKITGSSNKYILPEQKQVILDLFSTEHKCMEVEYICDTIDLKKLHFERLFRNELKNEQYKGKIKIYYTIFENDIEIRKILRIVMRLLAFFFKYTTNNLYFEGKLPDIKIYYFETRKCLPLDRTYISQLNTESSYIVKNEIIIYRKQELFKVLIKELQHYFKLDFSEEEYNKKTLELKLILEKTYNVVKPESKYEIFHHFNTRVLNPSHAYAELNATILNTILSTETFTKENLINNFYTEMLFSLYQTAKILNYQGMDYSKNIYKKHSNRKLFTQISYVFEQYYLKTKLLFSYNKLRDFIYDNTIDDLHYSQHNYLLKMRFPKRFTIKDQLQNHIKISDDTKATNHMLFSKLNKFTNFGLELLIPEDLEWNKALDIVMQYKPSDINLRTTKLEINK